jgi:PHP family Zn ribbon phosphoesterase
MKLHKSITAERIMALHEDDDGGAICYSCGADYDGYLEPDAMRVECTDCGEHAVHGYLDLLMEIATVRSSGQTWRPTK